MAYTIFNDGEDKDAWVDAHRFGVGASEVPILFGCGYGDSSELSLYAEKIGASFRSRETTEGMRLGLRLEGAIIEEIAERAGCVRYNRNKALLSSAEMPNCLVTPDAITANGEPVEVKNICNHINEDEWADGIPLRYTVQVQTQIGVIGASCGLFGALLFGRRIVWTWVDRDQAMINDIRSRVGNFWKCVESCTPPLSNGTSDARFAALRLSGEMPPVELYDSDIGNYLLDWESARQSEKVAKAQAKTFERKRRAIEDTLAIAMGSSTVAVTASGNRIEKTRQERSGGYTKPSVVEGIKITLRKDKQ